MISARTDPPIQTRFSRWAISGIFIRNRDMPAVSPWGHDRSHEKSKVGALPPRGDKLYTSVPRRVHSPGCKTTSERECTPLDLAWGNRYTSFQPVAYLKYVFKVQLSHFQAHSCRQSLQNRSTGSSTGQMWAMRYVLGRGPSGIGCISLTGKSTFPPERTIFP